MAKLRTSHILDVGQVLKDQGQPRCGTRNFSRQKISSVQKCSRREEVMMKAGGVLWIWSPWMIRNKLKIGNCKDLECRNISTSAVCTAQ